MREIGIEELRDLQLEILDYVDGFCRRHCINYTLSGGTLLGAVRHGGYIPWDDDIDIQMTRKDYKTFITLWMEESHHPFDLLSLDTRSDYLFPFGKVCDRNSVLYVNGVPTTGVFIDIFPVDNVSGSFDFFTRHGIVKFLYRLIDHYHRNEWISIFSKVFRERMIVSLIDKLSQVQNKANCEHTFEMASGLLCKHPIAAKVFQDYSPITFENKSYMAVSDYESYLTSTFGDYMTPPPPEKRVSHHIAKAYKL